MAPTILSLGLHLKRTHVARGPACLQAWRAALVGGQRLVVCIYAVVPQNVVRRELLAAMLAKMAKQPELGFSWALPTARDVGVEGGIRPVGEGHPATRRRVGWRLSLRLRVVCSDDEVRRPSGGRPPALHRWTPAGGVRGRPCRVRGGSGIRDSTRGTCAGCAAGAAL